MIEICFAWHNFFLSSIHVFATHSFSCITAVTMLENAFLDVAPDEALALNKRKRITRWDAKKRKFVKVSIK